MKNMKHYRRFLLLLAMTYDDRDLVRDIHFSSITLQTSSIRLQMSLTRPCDIPQRKRKTEGGIG